ncbi:MAG TPA: hypothetical protein VHO25_17715 [Polyangiaceae bacterium]|nr:hypothetical protein [Polyangiaceae bacterium]
MQSRCFGRRALLGALLLACDGSDDLGQPRTVGSSGGSVSTAGANGGSTPNPEGGTAGDTSVAAGGEDTGTSAGADQGGAGGAAQGGVAGAAGAGGVETAGTSGSAGAVADMREVVPSAACGVATAPDDGTYNIEISGVKTDCALAGCGTLPDDGEWSDTREYTLYKPSNYSNASPYTLVFLGPGCGGGSTNIYTYDNSDSIIRVGLSPSQNALIQSSHGTNPNQGCFDDKEGDDSVDFVLYEDLYDLLDTQLCFDKNRVFAGGNSSGAWLANELGCKYAGDATRPIRGIISNQGALPDQPAFMPSCTEKPLAGLWIKETGDTTHPFDGSIFAINRAMSAAGCPEFTTYDTAEFENYPIGGSYMDTTCRRILECNSLHPLVVCPLNGGGHGSHEEIVNPAASTFLQSFLAPPLAAP